jgi:thiopeptide-type bacteriocin biosynthesis protein
LKEEQQILKWFFIRYKDTDDHLRIRFLLSNPSNLAEVIDTIYPVLNALLKQNSVWKIQTDTYQREIERYGEKTIEDSETLFWHDSEMILQYLVLKSNFEKEETQLLFSFLAIDQFLNSFSRSNSDKLFLMDELQSSFKNEFNADKLLRKQMDKQYRELFPDMEALLSGAVTGNYNELSMLIQEKGNQVSATILSIKDRLQIPLASFLMSHIHMMLNRQYSSKQRMYELLIYDHMFRFYKMKEYKQFQDVIT